MPQLSNLPYYVLYFFTWPYYGTLVRYTIEPLGRIAAPQKDLIELSERVRDFALGKGEELKYISFAATINTALTVATFSWPRLDGSPWAVSALLYTSLFFTIGALVTGSQHIMFFHKMCPANNYSIADGPCDSAMHNMYQVARAQFLDARSRSWTVIFRPEAEGTTESLLMQRSINPSMLLTWQCPIALMAWSWVSYAIAIVVLIARPFIAPANNDTDEHKTAVFGLTAGAMMFVAFLWSSWFTYQTARSFKIVNTYPRGLPK